MHTLEVSLIPFPPVLKWSMGHRAEEARPESQKPGMGGSAEDTETEEEEEERVSQRRGWGSELFRSQPISQRDKQGSRPTGCESCWSCGSEPPYLWSKEGTLKQEI